MWNADVPLFPIVTVCAEGAVPSQGQSPLFPNCKLVAESVNAPTAPCPSIGIDDTEVPQTNVPGASVIPAEAVVALVVVGVKVALRETGEPLATTIVPDDGAMPYSGSVGCVRASDAATFPVFASESAIGAAGCPTCSSPNAAMVGLKVRVTPCGTTETAIGIVACAGSFVVNVSVSVMSEPAVAVRGTATAVSVNDEDPPGATVPDVGETPKLLVPNAAVSVSGAVPWFVIVSVWLEGAVPPQFAGPNEIDVALTDADGPPASTVESKASGASTLASLTVASASLAVASASLTVASASFTAESRIVPVSPGAPLS